MGKHNKVFSQAVSETKYFILGVGLVLSLVVVVPTFAQFGSMGGGAPIGGGQQMGGQQPGAQMGGSGGGMGGGQQPGGFGGGMGGGQQFGGQQMGGQQGGQGGFPGQGKGVQGGFPGQGKGVEGGFPGTGQGLNKDFGFDKNLKQFGEDFGKEADSLNEKFSKQKPAFEGEENLKDKFKKPLFGEGEGEQSSFGKKPAQFQEGEQGMLFDQKKGFAGQFGKMPPSKKINKQLRPKLDAAKFTKTYVSALLKLEGGTNEKTGKVTKGVIETLTDKIVKAKTAKKAFSLAVSAAKALKTSCRATMVPPNMPVMVDIEEFDCQSVLEDAMAGFEELVTETEDDNGKTVLEYDVDGAVKLVSDAATEIDTAISTVKSAIEAAVEEENAAMEEEQQMFQEEGEIPTTGGSIFDVDPLPGVMPK